MGASATGAWVTCSAASGRLAVQAMAPFTQASAGQMTQASASAPGAKPHVAMAANTAPSTSSGASSGTVSRFASGATSETVWKVSARTGMVATCAAIVTARDSVTKPVKRQDLAGP